MNPDGGNEDFWAHSRDAQYHGLVESGHRSHPTFDVLRRMDGYEKYLRSIDETIAGGERRGIEYRSLSPSFIPALNDRLAPAINRGHATGGSPLRVAEIARGPAMPVSDALR
jgi:hypothetical protein